MASITERYIYMRKNTIRYKLWFLWQFARDDFKGKYVGSVLGSVWALVQPMITILLYYFVFQLGFRSTPVEDMPFILWLVAGLVPWFYISDAVQGATSCLAEYSYLVKKVVFPVEILPLARLISVGIVQIALLVFTVVLFILFGYMPSIYYLQIPLFMVYMLLLTAGIVYLTSAMFAYFKDTIQVVSIIVQIVFWLTPFVWDQKMMPEGVAAVLPFNPVYYILNGYRSAFIFGTFYMPGVKMTVYYWAVAVVLCLIGYHFFAKCRKHFADVL